MNDWMFGLSTYLTWRRTTLEKYKVQFKFIHGNDKLSAMFQDLETLFFLLNSDAPPNTWNHL